MLSFATIFIKINREPAVSNDRAAFRPNRRIEINLHNFYSRNVLSLSKACTH
jgi:hypothetical protein